LGAGELGDALHKAQNNLSFLLIVFQQTIPITFSWRLRIHCLPLSANPHRLQSQQSLGQSSAATSFLPTVQWSNFFEKRLGYTCTLRAGRH
jgi:hypothetical protein